MAKISSEIKAPVGLGDVGEALHSFVFGQVIRGFKLGYENGDVILYGMDATNQPTFSELAAVVSNGGSFEGIKLGLEFTGVGAQADVPVIVPGATYTDENEVVQTRTWAEWVRSQPNVIAKKKIGEALYIIKAAYNGALLNSEQLYAAHIQIGVQVLEWAEMKLRNADETWEDFEL